MALKHTVYDTDAHFKIDPITHMIKNESSNKNVLIQHDHNSERFTFEIPRMVDGHDMSKCDVVQIHYINIDSQDKNNTSKDAHDVDDLQISPDGDDVVICSWLIDGNATKYAGSLNFLVKFKCIGDDGSACYVWNTAIFTGIFVSPGIENGEAIVEDYSDVLEQWRKELYEAAEKTHYTERVQVLARTDLDGFDGNEFLVADHLHLITGQEYIVWWNGVEYICKAMDINGVMGLGNLYALDVPVEQTYEPFAIAETKESPHVHIYPMDGSTRATISISRDVIHKLDNKYLDLDWVPKKKGTVILPAQIAISTNGVATLEAINAAYRVNGTKIIVLIDGIPHDAEIKIDGNDLRTDIEYGFCNLVAFYFNADKTLIGGKNLDGRTVEIWLDDAVCNKIPVEYLPDGYSSGGDPIIDVTELPTENINEAAFYRLLQGNLVVNQHVEVGYTVYCVDTLPEIGEPATNADNTQGNVYYSVSDGEAYGYVDSILSAGLGVPVGWYPAATLVGAVCYEYAGTISDILDDPVDGKYRLLLEYVLYSYKDGKWWTSHKKTVGGSSKIVLVVVTRDQYGNVESDKTYDQIVEESEGFVNATFQCAFKDRDNPVRVLPLFSLDDERLYFVQNLVIESVSIIHAVTIRPGNVSCDVVFYPLVKTVDGNLPDDNGNVKSSVGLGVTGAEVGQIVKISAVNQNGVPTAWEAVEFPSESEYELITTMTVEEEGAKTVVFDKYSDGTSYKLKKVFAVLSFPILSEDYDTGTLEITLSSSSKRVYGAYGSTATVKVNATRQFRMTVSAEIEGGVLVGCNNMAMDDTLEHSFRNNGPIARYVGNNTINRILFGVANGILPGSVVEIYGVRA